MQKDNDKRYRYFGRLGWCLKENIPCTGNCTRCTIEHFPEIEDEIEQENYEKRKKYLELKAKKREEEENYEY